MCKKKIKDNLSFPLCKKKTTEQYKAKRVGAIWRKNLRLSAEPTVRIIYKSIYIFHALKLQVCAITLFIVG